jgi:Tfp pilus assembly protein PilX
MYKKFESKKGFTLLIAIVVTSMLLIISFVVANIAYKQLILANSNQESQYAFYNADSGIECAVYWDFKNGVSAFNQPLSGSPVCNGQALSISVVSTATTTFTLNFSSPGKGCVVVNVGKYADGTTIIDSKGYNICSGGSNKKLERGEKLSYVNSGSGGGGGGPNLAYGGTRWSIPGIIQFENYDIGGAGVSYSDTDAGNNGGIAFRPDDVDKEGTCPGSVCNIGWVMAGEYLEYSVNVASTNTYSFVASVASPSPGGSFHLRVDGVDVPGSVTVPSTGGWQTYVNTSTLSVPLTVGDHTIRVIFDANGSTGFVGNIDYMSF